VFSAAGPGAAIASPDPRDGLRRRLDVVIPDRGLPFAEDISRFKLERDGLTSEKAISVDKTLNKIAFAVENRTGSEHSTGVRLAFPVNSRFECGRTARSCPLTQTGNWDYPWRAELSLTGPATSIELVRK
jgi:hypothetical protein